MYNYITTMFNFLCAPSTPAESHIRLFLLMHYSKYVYSWIHIFGSSSES